MAFDWMKPDISERWRAGEAARAGASVEHEIEDRAKLLMRLGYGIDEAKMRVRANLLWEFELHGRPAVADRCNEIVERVFARRVR